jgi:hypothetical protein
MRRAIFTSVVLYAALPYGLYQLLTSRGMPSTPALALTAVFPLVGTLYDWWRAQRLDIIGAASLLTIVVGVGAGLLSNSPLLILTRDSPASSRYYCGDRSCSMSAASSWRVATPRWRPASTRSGPSPSFAGRCG